MASSSSLVAIRYSLFAIRYPPFAVMVYNVAQMANFAPVYLSMSDQPRAILKAMDALVAQRAVAAARFHKRKWIPRILFLVGLGLPVVDFVLGYNFCTFTPAGVAVCLIAFFMSRRLRANRTSDAFAPQYATAREIVHTLRDDLNPKRSFFGHLDLTGGQQKNKLTREATNAQGHKVQFYRDEWLTAKLKLYDGNMVRLSVIEWNKVRVGYYKRNARGKQKWKAPKQRNGHEMKVRLSVNPQRYTIAPKDYIKVGAKVGGLVVSTLNTQGGIITLSASTDAISAASTSAEILNTTPAPPTATDILGVLRLTYDLLQRKDQTM
jgi:hypothetical protein